MTITVEFIDGPARGTVQSYPDLSSALPSLWWCSDDSAHTEATYHRWAICLTHRQDTGTTDWHRPDRG
jgi:hypothetical protein